MNRAFAPNLVLWIVIVAAVLGYMVSHTGNLSSPLRFVVKGGLVVWAVDEIFRGVSPWRRCLGTAVLIFEHSTILPLVWSNLGSSNDPVCWISLAALCWPNALCIPAEWNYRT